MHLISDELVAYSEKHSQPEPELLAKLNRETQLKVLHSNMISGHLQGRVLSLLSKLVRPEAILEIGTFTGYATLCLAEGLASGGRIDTLDNNEELLDFQKKYFDESIWKDQIHQHLGNALEIIPTLDHTYDLVFIDADKQNYGAYFDLIIGKMKKGGIILSDNVLWKAKVLEKVKDNDKKTKALMDYNEKINSDSRVETVLLPIRDGLTVSRVI